MRWGQGFLRNENWANPLWKRGRFRSALQGLPMRSLNEEIDKGTNDGHSRQQVQQLEGSRRDHAWSDSG